MLAPEQGCKVLKSVQLLQVLQLQHERQRWNGAGILAVLGMRLDDGIERERMRHRFTHACFPRHNALELQARMSMWLSWSCSQSCRFAETFTYSFEGKVHAALLPCCLSDDVITVHDCTLLSYPEQGACHIFALSAGCVIISGLSSPLYLGTF